MGNKIKVVETTTNVKGAIPWTRRIAIKHGKEELFAVQYWPDSEKSVEQMEIILFDWYRQHPQYERPEYGEGTGQ